MIAMSEEQVYECLADAGCGKELIKQFEACQHSGSQKDQMRLLGTEEAGPPGLFGLDRKNKRFFGRGGKALKRWIAILVTAMLAILQTGAFAECDDEISNYTRYADYIPQAAEPVGLIPGENHRTLVVWFSRVGNTLFLVGNAQMIAGWITEETKADVFQIQTAYTYPSDYDQTVQVGEGQDIDHVDLALASHLEDVSGYDTVWLVAPIWHYTVCTPLRAFLEETDLSGKTVYVMTTHCGSRFADTVEKIQQMQPNAAVIRGVAVSGFDPVSSETEVREFVRNTMK